jgi:predicted neuraminidase
VTSNDDGQSWSDAALVIDPDGDGPARAYDPELWLDPTGKLWIFWAQAIGHAGSIAGVWAMTTDRPDEAAPTWSAPRRLTNGIMMCKPTVLSTGEWVLPASTWRKTDDSAKAVVSTDQGKTWTVRGACNVPVKTRSFDEHMFVEKLDGTLWLLVRTNYGIGESFSTDRGKTWPELKKSSIAHTNSRFFIRRLKSKNLLLVKHGPIDMQTGRSHLTAFVSDDDGKTWPYSLMLDERNGVSYPDGVEAEDGTIYIIYDRNRTKDKEILLARFTEEDVRNGKLTSKNGALRLLVNAAGKPGSN